MKLIVGLGNPGPEYVGSRHNVGFAMVDGIAKQFSIFNFQFSKKFNADVVKHDDLILAKPQTFMNRSGQAVQALVHFYNIKPQDIFVIHDDLDIELGSFKIVQAKGPKIHNGLNSIEQSLGTKDFWRVRVGVDSRTPEERAVWRGRDYVLSRFPQTQQAKLAQVVATICQELILKISSD